MSIFFMFYVLLCITAYPTKLFFKLLNMLRGYKLCLNKGKGNSVGYMVVYVVYLLIFLHKRSILSGKKCQHCFLLTLGNFYDYDLSLIYQCDSRLVPTWFMINSNTAVHI